jgi:hypothetical protein
MRIKVPTLIVLKKIYGDVTNKLSIEYGWKQNLDSWHTIFRIVIEEVEGERVFVLRKVRKGQ